MWSYRRFVLRLIGATLLLNAPRLIVYVEDGGRTRRCEMTWHAVGPEAQLPPKTWVASTQGEMDYQRAEEASPRLPRFPR